MPQIPSCICPSRHWQRAGQFKGESAAFRGVFLMILSMTGFASTSREFPGGLLAMELRAVNHRYLDVQQIGRAHV